MKFGKKLRATVDNSYEEWRPMFMSYKDLKECIHPLKRGEGSKDGDSRDPNSDPGRRPPLGPGAADGAADGAFRAATGLVRNKSNLYAVRHAETAHSQFFSTFRHEVDKVNDFFLDKQEDYIIEHRQLSEKVAEYLVPARPTRTEVNRLRQRLINFHGELVLLENFSTVNYTGFRKILKKHDKKTGTNMRNIYLRTVLITPFFLSNTVRNLILQTEAHLASLDTVRKFRRAAAASSLALDAAPPPPKHAAPALPLAPATLSPCTKVVMEPPHPHAFISPRSALWRLYSEARSFGATMRHALARASDSPPSPSARPPVPTPPQALLDLVDDISAIELGLEPAFLAAVNRPSNYCIAGDDSFSMGFFIVTPDTKLQIFESYHGGAFITKNLRGRASLHVYKTAAAAAAGKPAGSPAARDKRDFFVEEKRAGITVGPWPAVPCHSRDMHVQWVPQTLCAIFYVCTPSLTADNDRMLCYEAHPLEQSRFRVSSDPDNVVQFVRITC